MLLDDLVSLRASADKRKRDLLAAKKAREEERARIEAAKVRAALIKAQEKKQREEDLANKKRQIEIDRKQKAKEKEIKKRQLERERLKLKAAETREVARLLDSFLKRSFKGYTYASVTSLGNLSCQQQLKRMGFQFVELFGIITDRNPTEYVAAQKAIRDHLVALKKDKTIGNQTALITGLLGIQEQVLVWLEKFGLPMPKRIFRKTPADRLEYFKQATETLLGYRTNKSAAIVEPFGRDQQDKIDSITAQIGHLIDSHGNFRDGVYATEREIVLRIGLESLKQQHASSIRSGAELDQAKIEVKKIPKVLVDAAQRKLDEIYAYEAHKREIDRVEKELLAISKQRMDCISWGESPESTTDSSVEYRVVHWFSSEIGQDFLEAIFSYLRSKASRSTAKLSVTRSSESMMLSVGRSFEAQVPVYITTRPLCVLFKTEGLSVVHHRISDEKEHIVLTW